MTGGPGPAGGGLAGRRPQGVQDEPAGGRPGRQDAARPAAGQAVPTRQVPAAAGKLSAYLTPGPEGRQEAPGHRLDHRGRLQFHRRGLLDGGAAGQRPVGQRLPQGRHRDDVPVAARRQRQPRHEGGLSRRGGRRAGGGRLPGQAAVRRSRRASTWAATAPAARWRCWRPSARTGSGRCSRSARRTTWPVTRRSTARSTPRTAREVELRSPGRWLASIRSPTFVFEGTVKGNLGSLQAMAAALEEPEGALLPGRGADHFSILTPTTRLIANKILKRRRPGVQHHIHRGRGEKPFGK